jgi:hypothetical protein
MIACLCGPIGDPEGTPRLAITIVPLDGSPATTVTPWDTRNPAADPVAIWLDNQTLVFADRSGLHRVGADGIVKGISGFDASELSSPGSIARIARVGDALAVLTLQGSGPTGIARLTVIERSGAVTLRRSFPSWNAPYFVPDSNRRRTLIVTDPQRPNEPPDVITLLSEGTPPQLSPLGPLQPSVSPTLTAVLH